MTKLELASPVANWKNKTSSEIIEDIASLALEWQRETNIYWTTPSQLLRLVDTNPNSNSIHLLEKTETIETVMWSAFSEAECLAWVSGPGFYKNGRVVLSKKYTDEISNKIRILNISHCLAVSANDYISIYEKYSGVTNTNLQIEDFRDRPVEFNLAENESFDDLVFELTGKTITELANLKNSALKAATEVEKENSTNIQNATGLIEQIITGAKIEQGLVNKGFNIHTLRDCPGISNTEALQIISNLFGTKNGNIIIYNPDRYTYDKLSNCRKCGDIKMVASPPKGCGICRDCQILFDKDVY